MNDPAELASDLDHADTAPPTTSGSAPRPPARATSDLVDRVRKLLDKAGATDNVHEREAFAAKAAELVATYRIDPKRLDQARATRDDRLGVDEFELGRGAYVRARLALLQAIAEAHDVRVVYQTTPNGIVALAAGYRNDRDIVEVMYSSLHQQAANQMSGLRKSTAASTQRYRRAFLFGFANRIGQILLDARARSEAAAAADRSRASGSMELALRERVERVEEFATKQWPSLRTASAPRPIAPDGFLSGRKAADRADLGRRRLAGRRQLGGGSKSAGDS